MKSHSTVAARVTHEEHREIRDYCAQFNINMGDMLRDMIMYVIRNVPLKEEKVVVFDLGHKRVISSGSARPLRGQVPKCETPETYEEAEDAAV